MKKSTGLFLFLIAFSLIACSKKYQEEITVVSTEEMKTLRNLEEVQLIDVRTKAEYDAGHLVNSQNIDYNSPTFDDDIAGLDKEKPVVLYCQKGGRSAKCAQKMHDAGFKKVYDLKGGFSKWQFQKLELDLNL
jgi:rhodanese-related sulfurtransferase